jgi:hypothetical protein
LDAEYIYNESIERKHSSLEARLVREASGAQLAAKGGGEPARSGIAPQALCQ